MLHEMAAAYLEILCPAAAVGQQTWSIWRGPNFPQQKRKIGGVNRKSYESETLKCYYVLKSMEKLANSGKSRDEIRFQDCQQTVIHQTEKKAVPSYRPWRHAKEA